MSHMLYSVAHCAFFSIFRLNYSVLNFLSILWDLHLTRETDSSLYFLILQTFNFQMIKLIKTPILPHCQVPNVFFLITINFIWWEVNLWGITASLNIIVAQKVTQWKNGFIKKLHSTANLIFFSVIVCLPFKGLFFSVF